jgi:hypothetical protein
MIILRVVLESLLMGRNLKAAHVLMLVEDHQSFVKSEYAVSHDNVFMSKNPAAESVRHGLFRIAPIPTFPPSEGEGGLRAALSSPV